MINTNLIDQSGAYGKTKDYTAKSVSVESVKIKWNKSSIQAINDAFRRRVWSMGYDIAAAARGHAPVVTGALRNSIRVEELDDKSGIQVIAGGAMSIGTVTPIVRFVNYAAKREIGPNRDPATEHYMQQAQNDIIKGNWVEKYFHGLTGAKP